MRTFAPFDFARYLFLPALLALPLIGGSVRVYQTNSAGDEVHIIDPTTNKVVQTIKDDGKYAIAGSIEGKMLTVIDEETLEPAWEPAIIPPTYA